MAAGPEISVESPPKTEASSIVKSVDSESDNFVNSDDDNGSIITHVESKKGSDSDAKSELKMQDFVDMLSNLKLNPMAKEFFPSSYSPIDRNHDQPELALNYFVQPAFFKNYPENGIEGYPNNRRRRNNYSSTRRLSNGRSFRAQREDSIKRTVYVSDIDHNVTEEQLAGLFSGYGHKLLRPEDEEHEESYQMMRKRERRQVYLHDYADEYCGNKEYGQLVVQQRLQMVHWIIEQSANKEFQKETMFLGVSLLDRFLSKGYFTNERVLQIVGIVCLTLATRIEENQPSNSIRKKSFNIGSNEYSRSEVVVMEWLVQEVLNFQCFLPTIYNFLWYYLKAARADEDIDKTTKYLAVLTLLGHEQLCFWPSTVAASLVIIACLANNQHSSHQQIAWIHDGSNDTDLPDCIKGNKICKSQQVGAANLR